MAPLFVCDLSRFFSKEHQFACADLCLLTLLGGAAAFEIFIRLETNSKAFFGRGQTQSFWVSRGRSTCEG